jgi:hypothetical protein
MTRNNIFIKSKGVNFIELLIGALLIEFIIIFFLFISDEVNEMVRDSKRKEQVSEIGKIITKPCFIPEGTKKNRELDLAFIIDDVLKGYQTNENIQDPLIGSENLSMYIYKVGEDNKNCVLYTNLENSFFNHRNLEIIKPTPGGGIGTFKSLTNGWNGSPYYFQYSN